MIKKNKSIIFTKSSCSHGLGRDSVMLSDQSSTFLLSPPPSHLARLTTLSMASHRPQTVESYDSDDEVSDDVFDARRTRLTMEEELTRQHQYEMLRPRRPEAAPPPPPYTYADQTIRELRQLTALQEKTIADYKGAMREMHRFYYRVMLISLVFGLLVGMRSQVRLVSLFQK
jgi:hypothetical protein